MTYYGARLNTDQRESQKAYAEWIASLKVLTSLTHAPAVDFGALQRQMDMVNANRELWEALDDAENAAMLEALNAHS